MKCNGNSEVAENPPPPSGSVTVYIGHANYHNLKFLLFFLLKVAKSVSQ